MIKATWTINNYTLGAKLKSAPTHKIVSKLRLDDKYTEVMFDELTNREYEFINKLLAKKGKILSIDE